MVDALVAMLLAGIAIAALTAVAASGVRHVRLARERSTALGLAADRLDALRAGPRDTGSDAIDVAGTRYVRRWRSDGGRGTPARLGVEVDWADGHVTLESGAYP
jgi:Tfp pilus assembly protein PilV